MKDVPFDAVAFSVMKVDGKFSADKEQGTGRGEVRRCEMDAIKKYICMATAK